LSHFCGTVEDPDKNPFYLYRNFISGAVSAFISSYSLFHDCHYTEYLVDKELANIMEVEILSSKGSYSDFCSRK
jgi:hypothetical protein